MSALGPDVGHPRHALLHLFDGLPIGLGLFDRALRCIGVNRWLADALGLAPDMVGLDAAALLSMVEAPLRAALLGEAPDSLAVETAGRCLLVFCRGLDGGEAVLLAVDATGQHRAEAALREIRDHYRHAVDLSPQIPWTAAPDGSILEFGPRWSALLGMSLDESLGHGWSAAMHPDDCADTLTAWNRSLATGEPFDWEYRLRLADGSYRWFRDRGAARREADGRITCWYGTLEDVHEHKATNLALRESEAFARSILDSTPNCVTVLDLDGRLLFMNEPGIAMLELGSFEPLRGTPFDILWPEDEAPRVRVAIAQARQGRTVKLIGGCPTARGTPKWWDVTVTPILGPGGTPDRLLAISSDTTEAKHARDETERLRRRAVEVATGLRAVLESTTDSIIVLDREWRITYLNSRAASLVGSERDLMGMNLWEAFPDAVGSAFQRHYERALAEQAPVTFEEFLPSLCLWLEVHAYPSHEGLSVFFRDIGERRRTQERMAHMARHDSLTGLANRLYFHERLENAIVGANPGSQVALLFLDLDQFKSVNDTLGHPAGDTLLWHVAARLRGCVRDGDTVARSGGDEFTIIQPRLRQPENASLLAHRLITALSEPYDLEGHLAYVGVSIGIALATSPETGADELLKQADIALYRAKQEGRGTYRLFEAWMSAHLLERQSLKAELRKALAAGEFELHFQPIVDLQANHIRSFEALLRWRHPRRGFIPPAEFVPVAEETGLIRPIGEWILREACRAAVGWPGDITASVNLSPVQFRSRDLVSTVSAALSDAGLEPNRLLLEITESVLLHDSDQNIDTLRRLRALGVRIAMDDFGTGYSSLSYLRSFPFDTIKIDRSFIGDLPDHGGSRAIVGAIVSLGASLGIAVTAEGIETDEQLECLRGKGCDYGQGYLFSPPVPVSEISTLIARRNGLPG